MSDSKITWLLELFNKRIFKFQKIVETNPEYIETRTDTDNSKIRMLANELNEGFKEEKAKGNLAS